MQTGRRSSQPPAEEVPPPVMDQLMEQGAEQFLSAGFPVGQDNAGVLYPQQHGGGQSGKAEQLHLMAYPRPAGGTAQTAQQSRVVHRPGFPAHRPHKAAVV